MDPCIHCISSRHGDGANIPFQQTFRSKAGRYIGSSSIILQFFLAFPDQLYFFGCNFYHNILIIGFCFLSVVFSCRNHHQMIMVFSGCFSFWNGKCTAASNLVISGIKPQIGQFFVVCISCGYCRCGKHCISFLISIDCS